VVSSELTAPAEQSEIYSESVSSNVIVSWFSGYITPELADDRRVQFRPLLARCSTPTWIMELTAMTGFDPRTVAAGAKWLRAFKESGGREILFISAQSAARAAVSGVALGMRIPVRFFDDLDECFKTLGIILPVRRSIPPLI
jgi:hypothetical protein